MRANAPERTWKAFDTTTQQQLMTLDAICEVAQKHTLESFICTGSTILIRVQRQSQLRNISITRKYRKTEETHLSVSFLDFPLFTFFLHRQDLIVLRHLAGPHALHNIMLFLGIFPFIAAHAASSPIPLTLLGRLRVPMLHTRSRRVLFSLRIPTRRPLG